MSNRNVLVTGGAGFIGFHLCQCLNKEGIHVTCLDNFNDYYSPTLKRLRAQNLHCRGIQVEEGDICNPNFLEVLVNKCEITHIVHLAAQAGVRYSLINPRAYIEANINGFLNILETCRKYPAIKLLYASSSSVYGTNIKIPFSIEDRTDHQANLYGVTKKTNELMAQTYHHLYGIPMIGLRFFTVYGPWGRPDMAYFSFSKSIIENTPIQLFNHGKMKRDFTFIDDIIKGIVSCLDLEKGCGLLNLGNNKPESLLYLVQLLEESLGKKALIQYLPMQLGDVEMTYADIGGGLQKNFKFQPITSLEEGIPRFIEWYKEYRKATPHCE